MEYRLLGDTGLKVSVLGVGCMTFGWRANAMQVRDMVSAALDIGINIFDTSVSYGRGASETLLGQALHESGRRSHALLATKFGLAADAHAGPAQLGYSRRNLIAQCELSLRRLQTDWIDLLQIHYFSDELPLEETLRGLDQLVREGKVRYIGCSNFSGWQLLEALWTADRSNLSSISAHQTRFNVMDRRAEIDVLEAAHRHHVGNLTYAPLAEGLLTGQYRTGEAFPDQSRFAAAAPSNQYAARLTADIAGAVQALAELASRRSMPLWRLSLDWVLANPRVTCALIGPSNSSQVLALADVSAANIDSEVTNAVDRINPPGGCIFR
jgi:aryl-alcohol dehydrogenase-like predicted oxidoreductase